MDDNRNLTDKERALFIYLFKILKNQGDDEYYYENMIKALQYGFSLHYKRLFAQAMVLVVLVMEVLVNLEQTSQTKLQISFIRCAGANLRSVHLS